LNKLLAGMLFAFVCINSHADDLKVADDFKSGDLVSADTFNQIFNTLESINRSVIDTDLIGVWNCSAIHASGSAWNGWESKGLVYEIKDAQVNFTASSAETSLGEAYSFSTSSPTPFWRSSDPASADTGTYQLFKGLLVMKRNGDVNLVDWQVDIVSDSRFTLYKPIVNGNQPNYVVCDSAAAVPASPTSPTATNNKIGINLAWTDASSDETGFKVYRKLSTETEAKLIATQTAVTYSDTDLAEAQTAYYQVVAYNDNGESSKSKTVSATLDSILPTFVSVTPANGAALTDADADFTGGDQALINGISATRNGGGTITITLTFSEEISVICQYGSGASATMCGGDSAVKFQGLNNTYYFLGAGKTGTTFSTTIPFTPSYGSNPDTFTVSVNAQRVQDKNGNTMSADFSSTFSVSDTGTYGSKTP
jgi:hypothetical protein